MSKSALQQALCCCAAVIAWSVSGCGRGPEAEFKLRESSEQLIPDANREVKKTLKENFGTPQELVAWARLPVSYGGVAGTVAELPEGAQPTANAVSVSFEGESGKVAAGAPLLWLTGVRSGEKSAEDTVAEWNPTTKRLTWSGSQEPTPAVGDKFVIGFGHTLQQGRVVYMKNCMHCHGVSGDGAGPTAKYLNPLPRDYRLGLFKFTSTLSSEKASRDDLHRIVKYGIPGTYMPSFLLLGEQETASVVEYVRWLAMRGEFEKRLLDDLADYSSQSLEDTVKKASETYEAAKKSGESPEKPISLSQARKNAASEFQDFLKEEMGSSIDAAATFIAEAWARSQDDSSMVVPKVPRVADDAASRERGRKLYLSDKTKCYTCHGMHGRGDGGATEDFWKKPGSDETYPRRGLHDAWGNVLQPRNLTLGQYRGGRRPVDLFRRLYAGIKGTPMPAFGGTALKDEEIWDVVNYVMSLPYQSSAPKPAGHLATASSGAAK